MAVYVFRARERNGEYIEETLLSKNFINDLTKIASGLNYYFINITKEINNTKSSSKSAASNKNIQSGSNLKLSYVSQKGVKTN